MAAARTTGILLGLSALLLLFLLAKPEGREPRLGASVSVTVTEPGELQLSRQDPLSVLSEANMRGGSTISGKLKATNITNQNLAVGFVLSPESGSSSVAAGQVWLRIRSGNSVLVQTNVPGLARGSKTRVVGPGEVAVFRFDSWIGGSNAGLYAGRDVTARLDAVALPVGGRGS